MLPQRSRLLRQGCAGHHPATPISKSGAGKVFPAGNLVRRVGETDGQRGRGSAKVRLALSQGSALDRRHGPFFRENLRSRSLAAGTAVVPRDFFLFELRSFSGPAGGTAL